MYDTSDLPNRELTRKARSYALAKATPDIEAARSRGMSLFDYRLERLPRRIRRAARAYITPSWDCGHIDGGIWNLPRDARTQYDAASDTEKAVIKSLSIDCEQLARLYYAFHCSDEF